MTAALQSGLLRRNRLQRAWPAVDTGAVTFSRTLAPHPDRRLAPRPGEAMVAVLERDPDLARELEPSDLPPATAAAVAPLLEVPAGTWSFSAEPSSMRGHMGLLLLEGLAVRHVRVGALSSIEFTGPGDILRPWTAGAEEAPSIGATAAWEILVPARIALLDHDFALRIRRWPAIATVLLDRAVARARGLGVQLTVRGAVRLEDRLRLALAHLAHRWGLPCDDGVAICIPHLTHEVLARVVGASRPPVTLALRRLADQGVIARRADGLWLLPDGD